MLFHFLSKESSYPIDKHEKSQERSLSSLNDLIIQAKIDAKTGKKIVDKKEFRAKMI